MKTKRTINNNLKNNIKIFKKKYEEDDEYIDDENFINDNSSDSDYITESEDEDYDNEENEEYDNDENEEYDSDDELMINLEEEDEKEKRELTPDEIENLTLDREFFQICKDDAPNVKKYFIHLEKNEKIDIIDKIKNIKNDDLLINKSKPLMMNIIDSETSNKNKSIIINKLTTLENLREHSEYFKLSTWIKKVMKVPFGKYTKSKITKENNLNEISSYLLDVKKDFDNAIYGHEDVKQQLLKILAQTISNPNEGGNVFALQGPPGVGKTELIKSGIATALGRPYSFISLGGAKDSSFLDGHDYTYEGSINGRIVDLLIDTKTMNPIIYFDELDKISETSYGNEIINCLMHITDSTQNSSFNDKYFGNIDFDLSKCIMIFSFNDENSISRILRDRMKIIRVKGYKIVDKINIAKKFLIPKLLKSIGLEKDNIEIDDNILEFIIETYTEEGGVRKFKELIEDILREINLRKLQNSYYKHTSKISITKDMVENDFLKDKIKIEPIKINNEPRVGVVNGLWANTDGIGGLIPIECCWIPSNDKLKLELTGMQGDVMKESMLVARTVAWKILPDNIKKTLEAKWLKRNDYGIHIHCPDGSTPKDGPSAGGAITVCLISLLTGKPINNKIAMTGEINLKGQITAIGGLEEKLFGAIKAGVEVVLCPAENKKDLDEIREKYPLLINNKIKIEMINNIWEILDKVLLGKTEKFNTFF